MLTAGKKPSELHLKAQEEKKRQTVTFTHALHASSTNDKIVISSPDTDVFMIAIAKFEDIPADL